MKYLTVEQVAKKLGVHEETVRKLCREKRLPCKKILRRWRIDEKGLNEAIERGNI